MSVTDTNIGHRPIARLDESAINRIAAGEVIERPASAVKELLENAIDAGATRIDVTVAEGGMRLIRVADDGCGIPADQLELALSRHATSKIDGSDLLNIHTFGFRGEALASLGAVGRLALTSRTAGADAHRIEVTGGRMGAVRPASGRRGTVVELADLFFATPARLKFLRTPKAELQAITDVVRRLAMAEPFVRLTLTDATDSPRELFSAEAETGDPMEALSRRLRQVIGRDFIENAVPVDALRDGIHLTGYAALPTYSRGAAVQQFFFVGGRPVKDRLLLGALRGAYADMLSRDRHPAAALFVDCAPARVDHNVHPAKSEVRFREPGVVRGLVVSALRHALAGAGHRASTTIAGETLGAFSAPPSGPRIYQMDRPARAPLPRQAGFAETQGTWARAEEVVEEAPDATDHPLGAARAQVHENYIVAQTRTGMVLVDQHAAHERLVYEKLKRQMAETGVRRQALLIPAIVELGADAPRLLDAADDLAGLGLVIEGFGPGTVAVQEVPALLGQVDADRLLRDILDELLDGGSGALKARLDAILSRIACHGSVRSGRRMRVEEMNALLREMEATPHSGQCNHGRPTHVELKLSDIERLFGRR